MNREKVIRMDDARDKRNIDISSTERLLAGFRERRPSKNAWHLAAHEREIIAHALVEYAERIPAEWALVYPQWMYQIASKLDITERMKAYARELDQRDAAKIRAQSK